MCIGPVTHYSAVMRSIASRFMDSYAVCNLTERRWGILKAAFTSDGAIELESLLPRSLPPAAACWDAAVLAAVLHILVSDIMHFQRRGSHVWVLKSKPVQRMRRSENAAMQLSHATMPNAARTSERNSQPLSDWSAKVH
jgi:hypothetical protein